MSVDLINKVLDVTENPETLIRVFLPKLRGIAYFAEKSVTLDSHFEIEHVLEFLNLIPESRLADLVCELENLNALIVERNPISQEQTFAEIVKQYIYCLDFGLWRYRLVRMLLGRKNVYWSHIDRIGDIIRDIFRTTDGRYVKITNCFDLIGYYAFSACALFTLAEKKHCKLSNKDIVKFTLVFLCVRMEYELRNLPQSHWLPMITSLLAQNGGRFFRLCKVDGKKGKQPIYKVVSDSIDLHRAVTPDWHDSLYKEIQRIEAEYSGKGLNRLFAFYVIDLFVRRFYSGSDTFIDVLINEEPYPTNYTLKRYFNLYLLSDLYNANVDINLWEPPRLIMDYLCSDKMSYSEKEQALREEFFPTDVYDLNAFLHYAAEYYEEKTLLDFKLENISNPKALDNVSIWYLSEWIIKERHYPFLQGYDTSMIASLIGDKVTACD